MAGPRRVRQRCHSTPIQQNASSEGSVDGHLQQSEPLPNDESSFRDEVHTAPTSESEPDVAKGSLPVSKKAPTYWTVDVTNASGHMTQTRLRVQDVFASNGATRVITRWNSVAQPVGESAGLLNGFLGALARNFNNIPIMFENWKKVPITLKSELYSRSIQTKFVVNDREHKKYILTSLGKKWRDTRCRLYTKHYDWELSLAENLQNHPPHIDPNHWAVYVNYRRSAKQMEIADKNAANREKLVIHHTLGSKTIARKKDELELLEGREYSKAEMYPISHKRKDGSFVSEEAREKNEQLQNEIHEGSSENDAFVKVFGKDHPGYAKGVGLGVTPSQVAGFRSHSERLVSPYEKIEKLEAEVVALKAQAATYEVLKEQIAFLMQNVKGNQQADLESSRDMRRSSESSHMPEDHGASSHRTI